ncbi:MAG TPA: type II secretion system F family protein [Acidimicrobiales bacterium]|nr:type II secretion system F family protein [Acidimicrobiales bacterium]
MPKYSYTAITPEGTPITGVRRGASLRSVNAALISRELQPVKVSEKRSIWQFEITRKRVPRKELMHFSRQLGAFLRAGIPVLEGLTVLSEEMTNKLFKKALLEMAEALQSGETFSESAEAHPEVFPPFYLGILRSAEVIGNLDVVLERLSDYIERDLEARQKIISALIYPLVVLIMSIVTVTVLTVFVMPRFEGFFQSFHAKLPLPTRMLLDISSFIQNLWYLIAIPLVGVLLSFWLFQRTGRGGIVRDQLLLKVPVFGDVVKFALIERFCRIMSSMVSSGVPLPDALLVVTDATNNVVFRRALLIARDSMVKGEGLATPLAGTGLFPPAARQMFRVGEDTGTLDDQLARTASYFDRELDYKIKRFTAIFEPVVICFMGLIVGFVAIALVSAMYGIYHQVQV